MLSVSGGLVDWSHHEDETLHRLCRTTHVTAVDFTVSGEGTDVLDL